ncbi:MAG: hypothetical protein AB1589_08025 [Cyanobacteriota bacterium]
MQSLEAEIGFAAATLGEFPVLATLKEFAPTEARSLIGNCNACFCNSCNVISFLSLQALSTNCICDGD